MYPLEAVRIAVETLAAHKLRSALTMLGIIIGVGAVVGMLAIGNGFQQFLAGQFARLGVGTFYLIPVVDSREVGPAAAPRLTAADAAALAAPGAVPGVRAVVAEWGAPTLIDAGGERLSYMVRAATANVFAVRNYPLLAGRHFSADEDARGARVAVVGRAVAERIAGSPAAAPGMRLSVNGTRFTVVGVIDAEADLFGFGSDPAATVFVPYRTGVARLFRNQTSDTVNVSSLAVQVRDPEQMEAVIAEVRALLRERHRNDGAEDRFTLINPDQFAQQADAVIGGFNAFLGLVAGIALVVGGIGIMNTMLVSVAERTAEIGLRKALGAHQLAILWQFLIEALLLALVGSLLGVLLGVGLAAAGTLVFEHLLDAAGVQARVTLEAMALAAGIAATVGIVFGLLPALRAARLSPIEALRTE